ncbi:hypothetical protein EVAR_64177_1 [Eumeta japonica]|uniref:Uncharacterized protein n=1 Tax=Eumeta variegata TaxID=151549 RepID=A0A4C1ZU72_EUMVA|nr:hypothetical protein EVAR_64177_1 [Eumeta japonica]
MTPCYPAPPHCYRRSSEDYTQATVAWKRGGCVCVTQRLGGAGAGARRHLSESWVWSWSWSWSGRELEARAALGLRVHRAPEPSEPRREPRRPQKHLQIIRLNANLKIGHIVRTKHGEK